MIDQDWKNYKERCLTRTDGSKEYYLHDRLHRIGGFAIERPDGTGIYSVNGVKITKIEHDRIAKMCTVVRGNIYDLFFCLNLIEWEYDFRDAKYGILDKEVYEFVDNVLDLKEWSEKTPY